MSANKIDVSTIFEMFEKLSDKLDKQTTDKPAEPLQVDLTAVNAMTERFENVIREARKPVKIEHRYKIEIASNWVFLSLVGMGLIILGLSYFIGNQRQAINKYKDNDLKYRYIKMQGQANDENFYRIEQLFKYNDSVEIIHHQVEKYEKLVREQAEKLERMKKNHEEAEKLQKDAESLKKQNK